jgi:hypothetical protein
VARTRNLERLHFAFGLGTQQHDQRLAGGNVAVERAVGLGQPYLNAVSFEQRSQLEQLVAVEGMFVLADDHRVEPAVGVGERTEQVGGLRNDRSTACGRSVRCRGRWPQSCRGR